MHAHPDDEAIFTGATIRRLADRGARVVLVTATAGELGDAPDPGARPHDWRGCAPPSSSGRGAARASARLVLLGRRDSGLPGWDARRRTRGRWCAADLRALARAVAALVEAEERPGGRGLRRGRIYGHPDDVAVHLLGRHAAALAGVTSYEATVDREHLHFAGRARARRAGRGPADVRPRHRRDHDGAWRPRHASWR